jgi:thymidine kinase
MFSGKTEELVRRGRLAAIAGQPVAIIKYRGDTRYEAGAAIATHAGRRQPSAPGSALCAPIRVVEADCLAEVVACESVVCVDEGQFYADLPEVCERWAHEGRVVVVAALDGDFARRPFGRVGELLPLCESVVKLQGVCVVCKQPAAFSQRLSDSRAVIEIAGLELYRAVCRACHDPRPCAE